MKIVIEGPVATLYKDGKAVLKISTKDDNLTAEVLDVCVIQHVGLSQMAQVVECEDIGLLEEGVEAAPGVIIQREIEPPIGEVVDKICRQARRQGK